MFVRYSKNMRLIRIMSLIGAVVLSIEASAITSCTEGDKKPVQSDSCSQYLLCANNSWQIQRCTGENQNFDPNTQTCRDGSKVPCTNQKCSSIGAKVPIPQVCNKYYVCSENGQVQEENCPWLHRFDVKTNSCQWWFKVDCSVTDKCSSKLPGLGSLDEYHKCVNEQFATKCSEGEIFNSDEKRCVKMESELPQSSECSDGQLEPFPGSCNKFYRCVNGKKVQDKCWFFDRFDTETLSCDYIWNANCNFGTECKSGDKTASGDCREYYQCEYGYWKRRECGTSIGLQMYFDQVSQNCMIVGSSCSDVECSIEGLKRPFPTDCSKYEICRKGRFYEESCGTMQKFDSKRNECVYFGAVCNENQNRPNCIDGRRYGVDGSCYSYQECVDGHLKTKHCFYPLYRFDKDMLSCTFMGECNTKCYDGEVSPVPGKCQQFYQCSDGQYFVLTCPYKTVFDVVSKTCKDPKLATCTSAK